MKLTIEGIKDRQAFEAAGIQMPTYDPAEIQRKTKEHPRWVHFGAGNIFRIFIGGIADKLITKGEMDCGITCVESFDFDVVDSIYRPYDNLVLAVTLKADGHTEKKVLGSLGEELKSSDDIERLKEIARDPAVWMFSFTITEKGYALKNADGNYFPWIINEVEKGPAAAASAMAVVCSLLYERYQANGAPLAVVSMDNCSHNGQKLQDAVQTMAKEWLKRGFVDDGFIAYISDENKISFPWTMIDKITPRPAKSVADELEKLGVTDMNIVVTSKNTYIAPFVNAEGPQYLVIEDKFPNGRPALQDAGVYMTDRDTVNKVERMKVTTCLNPLHTALAVYGCLLGYELIADEMKDTELSELVHRIGPVEGMPVVTNPGILKPEDFVNEVIKERLPNPFMPDTPQRIATDTSQKVGIRYGETIKAYMEKDGNAKALKAIPLAIAGWCRYLMGVDDKGAKFEPSSDPMLSELTILLSDVKLGDQASYKGQLKSLLSNANVFGVDLYKAGIGEEIEALFVEEIKGVGAVRETLRRHLA